MYYKKVRLFGRTVELHCRRTKQFLRGQNAYRELVQVLSKLKSSKDNEAVEISKEYEIHSLYYSIVLLSDSLKSGRIWWKFWNWNLYRKYSQSYIKDNVSVKQIFDCAKEIGIIEGNEVKNEDEDVPVDYIPLDEHRVKAFVHKHSGVPYDKIDDMYVIDFFDQLQFAGEMLRIHIEGGKINLTKEDEMAYHFKMFHKLKAEGKLGKNVAQA